MATSRFQHLSGAKIPAARNQRRRDGAPPPIEALERRMMLAVTASLAGGTLNIIGDDQDNAIIVSRTPGGTILVNNGAIPIVGGPSTIANTNHFHIVGAGGNDNISLNEANGALPGAAIFGGAGNDTLTGGSGSDFIEGDAGNDVVSLAAGDDDFSWNPGDGSDTVDGGAGRDTMTFNGSDVAENIALSASGTRALFTRDAGGVTMDLGGLEEIDLNAFGGADTVTVNDQSTTGLNTFNIDLNAASSAGDNAPDSVIINGTNANDVARINSVGVGTAASINATISTIPFVNITGSEGDIDALTVNLQGGNDTLDASGLSSQLIQLTVNGGPGNDTLTGSSGADTFVRNPGDGFDVIEGGDGKDSAIINGSDQSDSFDLRASGSQLQITPTTGGGATFLHGIENVIVNPLDGADTVTLNDLKGVAPNILQINLAATPDGSAGDRQPDTVILNATNSADLIPISGGFDLANNGVVTVNDGSVIGGTLPYLLNLTATEGDLDVLDVNTLAGNDTVDASGIFATNANQPIRLTIAGGTGNDTLTGSAGADTFVWNPGDGNDHIDGADGPDSIIVNGSDLSEKFNLSASGAFARFTRDLDGATTDFANVEEIDLNPLGGADTITVNDLTGTAVSGINLNLAGIDGATPDAQPDSVIINGTNAADSLAVTGRSGVLLVDGQFAGTSRYFTAIRALDPTDSLRINGNGGSDTVDVDLNFAVALSIDGGPQHDTINVTATAANSAPAIVPSDGDDDVKVNADLTGVANVRFDATQRIGALTIGNGGHATLTAGGQNVLTVTSLDIAPAAKLDVNNNALIIDYSGASPIANIQSLLQHGYNGGAWNGNGIMTTLGNASRFALGFAEASEVAPDGAFAGQAVDRTAVVLKFTLYGDANLDGNNDIFDLNALLPHFNNTGGWTRGDFNYDGSVNIFDLNALLPNFNTHLEAQLTPGTAAILTRSPDSVSSESAPPKADNPVPLVTGAKAARARATSPTSSASTAAGVSDSLGQIDVVKQRQQLRKKTR